MGNSIEIRKIGITRLSVDAIVNAANTSLWPGGGVCGAIFREAGYEELGEACKEIGGCEEGYAVLTPAFRLNAQFIIHAVGPQWNGGEFGEEEKLYSCYQESMKLAQNNNCHSIAFPLISAGIFQYPKRDAWIVALNSVNDYFSNHPECSIRVIFAVLEDSVKAIGERILSGMIINSGIQEETDKIEPEEEENAGVSEVKLEESDIEAPEQKYVFFWKIDEANGYLSNWYDAGFTVEGIKYKNCEQYMMAKKALLFDDIRAYYRIMDSNDPEECKSLGKGVKGFNDTVWDSCCDEIVYNANLHKFLDNEELRKQLVETGNAILAEASPRDKIWGIGLSADDENSTNPDLWQGKNKLGNVLMKIRQYLTELQ